MKLFSCVILQLHNRVDHTLPFLRLKKKKKKETIDMLLYSGNLILKKRNKHKINTESQIHYCIMGCIIEKCLILFVTNSLEHT